MLRGTRIVRASTLALLTAFGVALAAPPILAGESAPALTGVVNVNTATSEELQLLPGVGEARAKALIALRKERGGFKKLDDLLEVKGIGEAGLERMRPYLSITGKTTARRE